MVAKVLLLVGLAVFLPLGSGGGSKVCDLKDTTRGFFCSDEENILLPTDLVSEVAYYRCEDCDVSTREAGPCDECENEMEEVKSEKNVCPDCLMKPQRAEICRKVYFACEDCDSTSLIKGKCKDCNVDLKKNTSLALVEYRCSECEDWSLLPAKCKDDDCSKKGKAYVKCCTESETFPHVGVKALSK